MVAYYCFVNRGWAPHEYEQLPYRERVLVALFAEREAKERKEAMKK